MKIMIIAGKYFPNLDGGAERSTTALAGALQRCGDNVTVVTTSPENVRNTFLNDEVGVHVVPYANVYWPSPMVQRNKLLKLCWHARDIFSPIMAARVRGVIEAVQPDVVHSNILAGFTVSAWRAARQCGIPIVHTMRDFYLLCGRSSMTSGNENCDHQCVGCKLFTAPRKRMTDYVDGVVGVSEYMLKTHLNAGYFPNAKITAAIPNICEIKPSTSSDEIITTGICRLGYIGRLHPTKGVEVLIEACKSLPGGKWTLQIAGTGLPEYVQHLRHLSDGLPINLVGQISPEEFYNLVDAVVVPSLWNEPLPRSVLEAFAYGKAVIGSRRGGLPEAIRNGVNGLLFEPSNPIELSDLLLTVVTKPEIRQALAVESAKCAHQVSAPSIVARYRALYNEVVSNASEFASRY